MKSQVGGYDASWIVPPATVGLVRVRTLGLVRGRATAARVAAARPRTPAPAHATARAVARALCMTIRIRRTRKTRRRRRVHRRAPHLNAASHRRRARRRNRLRTPARALTLTLRTGARRHQLAIRIRLMVTVKEQQTETLKFMHVTSSAPFLVEFLFSCLYFLFLCINSHLLPTSTTANFLFITLSLFKPIIVPPIYHPYCIVKICKFPRLLITVSSSDNYLPSHCTPASSGHWHALALCTNGT
jgi:hypothetical protein